MNDNFTWWIEESFIGGMMSPIIDPLRRFQGQAQLNDFDDDLPQLYAQGIRSVVSLINAPGQEKVYESAGFQFLNCPIKNFHAPSLEQSLELFKFINSAPKPLLVTCEGGLGKTGTVLAAWLISQGKTPQEAIETIRKAEPGAIESEEQFNFLITLPESLQSKI
jgi:atypical dual specificity phosphatase